MTIGSLRPRKAFNKQPEIPACVNPKYRKTLLSQSLELKGYSTWRGMPNRRALVFFLDHISRSLSSGMFSEYSELFVSHPYTHRPLVEFCLAVPVSQILRDAQTTSLMRRAMRDLLPAKTLKSVGKGTVDEVIFRTVRQEWKSISNM